MITSENSNFENIHPEFNNKEDIEDFSSHDIDMNDGVGASAMQGEEVAQDGNVFTINDDRNRRRNDVNDRRSAGKVLWSFVLKDNSWYIRIACVAVVTQLLVFKFLYPYASFINGDSYSYIETAYHNFSINTYPVGYSMLLRFFSIFTKSDTVVVSFQYFLIQGSVLVFIFTLFFFYRPSRLTKNVLFGFVVFNPVFLYLANYISSDAFFLSLSMIWFTQLLWIIEYPTNKLILINAIVLFVAFTVRYNALFYPVVAIVSLFQGKRRMWFKIWGIVIGFLLIINFIQFSSNKYYQLTGHRQFTPFTGWQTANNALYAYRYVDSSHVKAVPSKFADLDRMVRNYFDTTKDVDRHPEETLMASTVYMWAPNSPLTLYMEKQFKGDSTIKPFRKWATVAPFMEEYGSLIIRKYPREYIKYYLVPNALKYYAPPVEFLDSYSTGIDSVQPIASVWFNYRSNKLKTYFKDYRVKVLDFFPVLTGTMNIVLVFSLISFIILNGPRNHPRLKHGMLLVIALWVINLSFSVFASPIALRFQLFPIIVSLSFTVFLVEFLVKSARGIGIRAS